jgi:hypothetical protein
MNDDFLKQHRRAPRPEFAARLYERISGTTMDTQPQHGRRRTGWLAATTLLAGACFALLLFPPARAFADSIWHQIGAYVFVQGAPDPNAKLSQQQADDLKKAGSPAVAAADATKQAVATAAQPNKPAAASAAEASQQAGFSVLAPSYVPAGYQPSGGYAVDRESEGVSVMTALIGPDPHNGLKLIEFKLAAGHAPLPLYGPEAQDVTVRGQPGWLLPGEANTLVWEENGITYSLVAEGPSLAELMRVAEGLR